MKNLPIGIDNFKTIIDKNYYFIDKTLLIKELLDSGALVTLLPRPRRFGKTLNLSMLKHFFEKIEESNEHLFLNTNIWKYEEYHKFLGQYPVIFITFKDIKENTFELTYQKIAGVISKEFERYFEIVQKGLSKDKLENEQYKQIMLRKSNEAILHGSLKFLSEILHKHFGKKVVILIDEYDSPIHASYSKEHYQKVVHLIRSIFSDALKGNDSLEFSVMTGIMRTAKEGIFSGLNNLVVYSVLSNKYQDKFGFTQQETEKLLIDQNISDQLDNVTQWYNGYKFGQTTIYNPWSIISFANEGTLRPHWGNTSSNDVIRKIISSGSVDVKRKLELLLSDTSISAMVDEGVVFPGIEKNPMAIWSLLLFAGYLTCENEQIIEGDFHCNLKIPNQEIKIIFKKFITEVFQEKFSSPEESIEILNYLINGNIEQFSKLFYQFILNSTSFHDISDNETEKSYHTFVLGMLVHLIKTYQVKSNHESGYGRYDIMLIPRDDKNRLGIIIEFKKTDSSESLESAAQNALKQIHDRNYAAQLRDIGVNNIKALGIAFEGRKSLILSENV